MHKVTLVGLGGDAYQCPLMEDGYVVLQQYLARAERRLKDDPDRAEVLADLERSIGEKFTNLLRPDKRIITAADVRAVLDEVGTVDMGESETGFATGAAPSVRRRLHRLRENQKIAGICTGLAAYADLDVTLIRVLFVLLALFTGGMFILLYIIAIFIIPVAQTPEEHAAAHGMRVSA